MSDLGAVETRDATFAELRAAVVLLREQNAELVRVIEMLPLSQFSDDMSESDAADFVDNSNAFFEAMVAARAILSKRKGQ